MIIIPRTLVLLGVILWISSFLRRKKHLMSVILAIISLLSMTPLLTPTSYSTLTSRYVYVQLCNEPLSRINSRHLLSDWLIDWLVSCFCPPSTRQLPESSVDAVAIATQEGQGKSWFTDLLHPERWSLSYTPLDLSTHPWICVTPIITDCPATADEGAKGGTCGIPFPSITIDFHGTSSNYMMTSASSPWPLQIGGDVDQWIQVCK